MSQTLGYAALLVRDYDEALEYFTKSLGFTIVEDSLTSASDGGRNACTRLQGDAS